jgi:addiction module RelB/DinJ family antitoxin
MLGIAWGNSFGANMSEPDRLTKYNCYIYFRYMKTLINIKTDKEVKDMAQYVARELGVPLSTVINAYLKEFVRDREIRLSLEPKLRPEIEKLLKQASRDYRRRRNISPVFTGANDMDRYLDA